MSTPDTQVPVLVDFHTAIQLLCVSGLFTPKPEGPREPFLYDFATACEMLGISGVTLREKMHAGLIAAQRDGKKILFQPDELRRYAADLPSWEPK